MRTAPKVLAGMNVAVTGGAHGIGRSIAEQFIAAGATVTIGDIDAAGAAAAARAMGGKAEGVRLDVSDVESYRAFLDAAEADHGAVDVLVNNAGIDWIGPFHEEPFAVTRREVDVNLMGTIIGSRLAIQRWQPLGRGHLVNVSSGVGRTPLPGSASYSATKHGIVGLTESLRLEYRNSGLRFSLIQPGQVETAMMDGLARSKLLAVVAPDDVAAAVLDAVRRNRFEVYVPASQMVGAKIAALLPRRLREAALLALGLSRLTEQTNMSARLDYNVRTFPKPPTE